MNQYLFPGNGVFIPSIPNFGMIRKVDRVSKTVEVLARSRSDQFVIITHVDFDDIEPAWSDKRERDRKAAEAAALAG